jgi:hypothetical protein
LWGQDKGISEQVAAASTSMLLQLRKPLGDTRGRVSLDFFGVNLGNIIFVLLNLALFEYFNSIEINI